MKKPAGETYWPACTRIIRAGGYNSAAYTIHVIGLSVRHASLTRGPVTLYVIQHSITWKMD